MIFVVGLAVASCAEKQVILNVTEPCDVLVYIPDAPTDVNAIIVDRAKDTAIGLARHKERFKVFECPLPIDESQVS